MIGLTDLVDEVTNFTHFIIQPFIGDVCCVVFLSLRMKMKRKTFTESRRVKPRLKNLVQLTNMHIKKPIII